MTPVAFLDNGISVRIFNIYIVMIIIYKCFDVLQ